ncbi:MAG: hypothetical protein ABI698_08020 [bacterium]
MESQITTAETGLELPLPEPHFDDEATVLSARPVVPLDQVEFYEEQTPGRFARGWVFAATIAGAMLLGVFVGIGYYSYANRQPSQPFVADESIVAGVEGMAIQPAGNSDALAALPEVRQTTPANAQTAGAVTKAPAVFEPVVPANETSRPVARRVAVLVGPSSHEERKAARRLAKQLEREGRDRNLTRIREIFEGPQRP